MVGIRLTEICLIQLRNVIGCADCQPTCFHSFILSLFLCFLCWWSSSLYAWCPCFESYFYTFCTLKAVCIRVLPVCRLCVLLCDSYVTRMYSYVFVCHRCVPVCTRILLVCTRVVQSKLLPCALVNF